MSNICQIGACNCNGAFALTWHESRPPSGVPAQKALVPTAPPYRCSSLHSSWGTIKRSTYCTSIDIGPFEDNVPQPAKQIRRYTLWFWVHSVTNWKNKTKHTQLNIPTVQLSSSSTSWLGNGMGPNVFVYSNGSSSYQQIRSKSFLEIATKLRKSAKVVLTISKAISFTMLVSLYSGWTIIFLTRRNCLFEPAALLNAIDVSSAINRNYKCISNQTKFAYVIELCFCENVFFFFWYFVPYRSWISNMSFGWQTMCSRYNKCTVGLLNQRAAAKMFTSYILHWYLKNEIPRNSSEI